MEESPQRVEYYTKVSRIGSVIRKKNKSLKTPKDISKIDCRIITEEYTIYLVLLFRKKKIEYDQTSKSTIYRKCREKNMLITTGMQSA